MTKSKDRLKAQKSKPGKNKLGKKEPWRKKDKPKLSDLPSNLPLFNYMPPKEAPELIYSDAYLVVFNKPAGLLSVPGAREGHDDCLVSRVQIDFPTARIVHRLDMDTSGLIVLALDAETHRKLSMQFEKREVNKTYEALVWGHPKLDEGIVTLPLMPDWPNRPKQKVDFEDGKKAETRFEVIERMKSDKGEDIARVALYPKTGRSHQLRVHMAKLDRDNSNSGAGHAILGDVFYASEEAIKASPRPHNRLCLHATHLAFTHPKTGKRVSFESAAEF